MPTEAVAEKKSSASEKPQSVLARYGFSASVAVLGVLMLVLIHRSVYAYLTSGDDYTIDLATLHVADRPEWAGDGLISEIKSTAPLSGKMSIFDPDLTKNVTEHYQKNPWVSRVLSVQKEFPNTLRVKVEMRKPLVAVERKGEFILIDRDGVRIPGSYVNVPKFTFTVCRVLGVRSTPPEAGKKWSDVGVDAAVGVASALSENRVDRMMTVHSIDVSRVGRGGRETEVILHAEDSVPIEWGRSPSSREYGELTVEEKVRNLKGVLMSQPRLKGVGRVKVQFDDPVVIMRR
ncbi:MAG: hypothetical protein AAB074_07325 [Planctomycetota bacterium]